MAETYWKNPNQEYLIAMYGPNGGALKSNLQLDGVEVPYKFVSMAEDEIAGTVTIKVVAPDCGVL